MIRLGELRRRQPSTLHVGLTVQKWLCLSIPFVLTHLIICFLDTQALTFGPDLQKQQKNQIRENGAYVYTSARAHTHLRTQEQDVNIAKMSNFEFGHPSACFRYESAMRREISIHATCTNACVHSSFARARKKFGRHIEWLGSGQHCRAWMRMSLEDLIIDGIDRRATSQGCNEGKGKGSSAGRELTCSRKT